MIRNVADILRNYVATVEWVDVAGGIAQPIRVGDKISPAWWDGNKWIDMSPDSKKRGIVFFRADESEVTAASGGRLKETCDLNMLCWYNMKEINMGDKDSRPVLDVCDVIPGKIWHANGIITARIQYQNVNRDINVFNDYTFNENKAYTVYPYGVFMVTFRVDFWYALSCHTRGNITSSC